MGMRMDREEGKLGEKMGGEKTYGGRERKGMRQKERQRVRTQQGKSTGWSVTWLRPHIFSVSLPIWPINQQREQGKINKNSPAGTTAHHTATSFTDKSPQPSTSIKQLYSLTFHFLLSFHPSLILSLSRFFFYFSPVFPIHHCQYGWC